MTLDEFMQSWKGQKLAPLFSNPAVIEDMETLNRLGVPAIKAIDKEVADAVGTLDDVERQHVGRWVRDTLGSRGWRSVKQRAWRGGRVFRSGMIYEPVARADPMRESVAVPDNSEAATRIAKARLVLMAGRRDPSLPLGTVDNFLAERRLMWSAE